MGISGTQQALMYALSNVMRAGASRAGYHSGDAFISIGGIQVGTIRDYPTVKVLIDSLEITDVLDQTPNTCTMKLMGAQGWAGGPGSGPPLGAEIIIALGSTHNTTREFAGVVLAEEAGYEGKPVVDQGSVVLRGIDYTYVANYRKVLARYQTRSATDIATDIITRFAPTFTTANVQAGLPTVDEITFTNQDVSSALTALAKRIGASWFIDYYKDLHFFLEETVTGSYPDPQPITAAHRSLADVRVDRDLSQVVTQVLCEGGGSTALVACAVGETIIPIADPVWYPPSGTVVSGPQRITYTARQVGGGGALVGPGVSPSVAPAAAVASGSGLATGGYVYAYTWITLSGETLPSPISGIIRTGPLAAPTSVLAWNVTTQYHTSDEAKGWDVGDAVDWFYSYGTTAGANAASARSPIARVIAVVNAYGSYYHTASHPAPTAMALRLIYSPDPRVTHLYVWMQINSGPVYVVNPDGYANHPESAYENGGAGYQDAEVSSPFLRTALGAYPPTNPGYNQAALTGIAVGPSGVTSRKVYRTAADLNPPLKLLTTIANNTATTLTDATPDASLGAAAPSTNTSGLVASTGQVLAGSTSLQVSGTGAFSATGGWALTVTGQLIRYTSISATALLGIPASGVGALTETFTFGTNITAVAALTGVPASGAGAIVVPLLESAEVNVLATAADLSIQAYLAGIVGGDGVVQDYLQDNRLSYQEALARAQAHLLLKSRTQITITYTCRDRHTRAGRTVSMNLTVPAVTGLYKIQQVTISRFGPHVLPTYTVTASTERFSFEDLLRMVKTLGGSL